MNQQKPNQNEWAFQDMVCPTYVDGQQIESIPHSQKDIDKQTQQQIEVSPKYSSLVQEFSDFSFFTQSYPKQQIKIKQLMNDLNRNLDQFLNDNIKSILSLARQAQTNEQFQTLINILKIILKRRVFASKQIVVLIKHFFLIKQLIPLIEKFPNNIKLNFSKALFSFDENHYNSPYTNSQIKEELENIYKEMPSKENRMEQQNKTLFNNEIKKDINPLAVIYINQIIKTSIFDAIKQNIPFSLNIVSSLLPFVNQSILKQKITEQYVMIKMQQNIGIIFNLPKNDIQLIMKHLNIYLENSSELKNRFLKLEMRLASEMFSSSSIQKKIWALSVINEKIRFIKMGLKDYAMDVEEFLTWIEKNKIYQNVVQFNVHSEIINRSNQLVRFLYDNDKIGIKQIEQIILLALKSQSDSITGFVHNLLVFLTIKDLEESFDFLVSKIESQSSLSSTMLSLLESIINNNKLPNSHKEHVYKYHKKKKNAYKMQQISKHGDGNMMDFFDDTNRQKVQKNEEMITLLEKVEQRMDNEDQQLFKVESIKQQKFEPKMIEVEEQIIGQPSPLSRKIFKYIVAHYDEYSLTGLLVKLINNEPAIFVDVPPFLISTMKEGKYSSIQLLDSIIKLSFPIPKQNGLWTRSELVSWLANEGLFEHLIRGLALNRFQKSATERINLIILLAKYHNKPFELVHVQYIWKILGLRAIDEKQREQFFIFIKDCLTKSNNMLFTQECIHYIYFQILLKLHAGWFTIKVYQCLQMFFIRLNLDCKLIAHSSGIGFNSATYELMNIELIGLKKLWYIYLRGEDPKVTKKCKQFLCRLIGKFEYTEKIAMEIKEQYIEVITSSIKQSYDIIRKNSGDNNVQYTQISRSLQILIKIIQDLDGINITGQKIQGGEEWSININNNIPDSMPPKKFTMKVNTSSTLRSLRQQIGSKINPPKKQNQIKLMTRGNYQRGQNMTLKQLKYTNKQTFYVEANQQILPQNQNYFNENTFEMLKMMFPNHSDELLKFVLLKRLGEDQQTIAQALLDEQIVNNYLKQLEGSKIVPKHLSEFLVSNIHIFEIFFQVLGLHSQQHSFLVWQLISNLPSNPHSITSVKKIVLQTHEWNEVFSFNSANLFKTLYNLQLLCTMLTGGASAYVSKNQQTDLTNKLVQTGGFEHIWKYLKSVMANWKGDFLQAKLLTYLIQVLKIYLKPHLTQIVKQPLNFMFSEVMNYQKHLKQLRDNQIRHIITQIVSPDQTNTITSKSYKSFSFKGQSASSHATPQFKSHNDSGLNSPHSQTPKHQKQQDNISQASRSKSINTSKNSKKRRHMIQYSFQTRMRHNTNLQLSLQSLINITQLVQLIFRNLKIMIENPQFLNHEDIAMMSQQLFEILFPILLINNSYSVVFNDNSIGEIVAKGMAQISREEFRIKLVYLIFLLCVIEQEDKLIVEDDDQLFLTEAKKLKPRIFFLKTLIPIFYSESALHQTYFICFSKLIKQIDPVDLKEFFEPSKFIEQILKRINSRPVIQTLENDIQDYTLNGLLLLLQVLLEKYKSLKSQCSGLVLQLIEYLFELPIEEESQKAPATNYPKCKRKTTRKKCFDLLNELCKDQPQNKTNLQSMLTQYCKDLRQKQYYDSVVLKAQKYSGLKNLGATCYINSLLQQFHKNTDLKYLLTNPSVININVKHPLHELSYLFASLSLSLMSNVNPMNFIKTVRFHGNEQINPKIQQDVNEFFMAFADLMERNEAKNILQSCLMGKICNEISCCQQDESLKFIKKHEEQFYTITLDIKGKKNLQEALQYFVKGDLLDGDNKYYSSQLDRKVRAIKRSYLKSLPNSLAFTLKRFEFDYNTMLRYKLNDYFEFPLELDVIKYTQQVLSESIQEMHDENYFKYKLSGVLVHSGTAESGHYYSFIRDAQKWYEFNDSQVSQFNINNLKTQCFGGEDTNNRVYDFDNRSRNAYILFYERVSPLVTAFTQTIKTAKQNNFITGAYSDLVWKQNFQFLKSRLVYDMDFFRFLQQTKCQNISPYLQIRSKPQQQCFFQFQNNDVLDQANPDIVNALQGNNKNQMFEDNNKNQMRQIQQDSFNRPKIRSFEFFGEQQQAQNPYDM